MLVKWNDLTQQQKREVRAAFVHWRYDTTVKTFEDWATKHAFYITRKGHLDHLPGHCEPSFLAEG